jgi:Ca2+-binding RTX toxin-like protein
MGFFDDIGDFFDDVGSEITHGVYDGVYTLESGIEQFYNVYGNWFYAGWDQLQGLTQTAIDQAASTANWAVDAVASQAGRLQDILMRGTALGADYFQFALNQSLSELDSIARTALTGFYTLKWGAGDFVEKLSDDILKQAAKEVLNGGDVLMDMLLNPDRIQGLNGLSTLAASGMALPKVLQAAQDVYGKVADGVVNHALPLATEAYGQTRSVVGNDELYNQLVDQARSAVSDALSAVIPDISNAVLHFEDGVLTGVDLSKAGISQLSALQGLVLGGLGVATVAIGDAAQVGLDTALACGAAGVSFAGGALTAFDNINAVANLTADTVTMLGNAGVDTLKSGVGGAVVFGVGALAALGESGMRLVADHVTGAITAVQGELEALGPEGIAKLVTGAHALSLLGAGNGLNLIDLGRYVDPVQLTSEMVDALKAGGMKFVGGASELVLSGSEALEGLLSDVQSLTDLAVGKVKVATDDAFSLAEGIALAALDLPVIVANGARFVIDVAKEDIPVLTKSVIDGLVAMGAHLAVDAVRELKAMGADALSALPVSEIEGLASQAVGAVYALGDVVELTYDQLRAFKSYGIDLWHSAGAVVDIVGEAGDLLAGLMSGELLEGGFRKLVAIGGDFILDAYTMASVAAKGITLDAVDGIVGLAGDAATLASLTADQITQYGHMGVNKLLAYGNAALDADQYLAAARAGMSFGQLWGQSLVFMVGLQHPQLLAAFQDLKAFGFTAVKALADLPVHVDTALGLAGSGLKIAYEGSAKLLVDNADMLDPTNLQTLLDAGIVWAKGQGNTLLRLADTQLLDNLPIETLRGWVNQGAAGIFLVGQDVQLGLGKALDVAHAGLNVVGRVGELQTVFVDAANLAALQAQDILDLAHAGFDRIVAQSGDFVLDLSSALAAGASGIALDAVSGIVGVKVAAEELAHLTAAQIHELAQAGVQELEGVGEVIIDPDQYLAAAQEGLRMGKLWGESVVFMIGLQHPQLLAAIQDLKAFGVTAIRVVADIPVTAATALDVIGSGLLLTYDQAGKLVVDLGSILNPSQLQTLVDHGIDWVSDQAHGLMKVATEGTLNSLPIGTLQDWAAQGAKGLYLVGDTIQLGLDKALAIAHAGLDVVGQAGQLQTIVGDAASLALLKAQDVVDLAHAGFDRIVAQSGDFVLDLSSALAAGASGIALDAVSGIVGVKVAAEEMAHLTAAQIHELAQAGVQELEGVGEVIIDPDQYLAAAQEGLRMGKLWGESVVFMIGLQHPQLLAAIDDLKAFGVTAIRVVADIPVTAATALDVIGSGLLLTYDQAGKLVVDLGSVLDPSQLQTLVDHGIDWVSDQAHGLMKAATEGTLNSLPIGTLQSWAAQGAHAVYGVGDQLQLGLDRAQALAQSGLDIVGPGGAVQSIVDDAARFAQLQAGDIARLAHAGFDRIVATGGPLVLDLYQAQAAMAAGLGMTALNGLIEVKVSAQQMASLTSDQIAALGHAGVNALQATGDLLIQASQYEALKDGAIAIASDVYHKEVLGISDTYADLLNDYEQLKAFGFDVVRIAGDVAVGAQTALGLIGSGLEIAYDAGARLIVEYGPELTPSNLLDLISAGCEWIDLQTLGLAKLAGAELLASLPLSTLQDWAAQGAHGVFVVGDNVVLGLDQAQAFVQTGLQILGPGGQLQTILEDASHLTLLHPEDLAALAHAGFDRIVATGGPLVLDFYQAQAALAAGLLLDARDGLVELKLNAEQMASLTADQLTSLAHAGLESLVGLDGVIMDAAQYQALVANGIGLDQGPGVFLVRIGSGDVGVLDGFAAMKALGVKGLLMAGDVEVGAQLGLSLATSGLQIGYLGGAKLAVHYSPLLSTDNLTTMMHGGIFWLHDEGAGLLKLLESTTLGLTPMSSLAAYAAEGAHGIFLVGGDVEMGLDRAQGIAQLGLTLSGPPGQLQAVVDGAADLARLTPADLAHLAQAGFDRLVANDGALVLDLAQAEALLASGLAVDSLTGVVELSDHASAFAGLTREQIAGLAAHGIEAVEAAGSEVVPSAIAAMFAAAGIDVLDAVNNAPVAGADAIAVTRDADWRIPLSALLGNDIDADSDTLSVTAISGVTGATAAIVGDDVVVRVTAASASFTYTVSDGHGGTSQATVALRGLLATDGADKLAARPGELAMLAGGEGADQLTGDAGADLLQGGGGNDRLSGQGGADSLYGGEGKDILDGGAGDDVMTGGAGDDTYIVDSTADVVVEADGEGIDTVKASSPAFSLSDNVENLVATGPGDFVGTGNDLANSLTGGAGADSLSGLGGDDRVSGLGGDDTLYGGDGKDVLDGGDGGDGLYGGAGDDSLKGGAGDDQLFGGDGKDTLDGGPGADSMAGGAGDDTYLVDSAGDTATEAAGEGTDTVKASTSAYTLSSDVENLYATGPGDFTGAGNASNNAIAGAGGNDTLSGLDGDDKLSGLAGADLLYGGAGKDSLDGGDGTDSLYGGAGDDSLKGGADNDVLFGGDGKDTLDGGAGDDAMSGGAGDDTYVVDSAGDTVSELSGEGVDTVRASVAAYGLSANVENLTFTGAGDFQGTGNALNNTVTGGAGADSLWGLDGDDKLSGLAGNDHLYGGDGKDTLDGGAGVDILEGGAGDDTYLVDNIGDVIVETANAGVDSVKSTANAYTLADNMENLSFVGAGDFIGVGNGLANQLTGGAGNDQLYGGAGADKLNGGAGNDMLYGGGAADQLTGGAGADAFVFTSLADFAAGATLDTITDFTRAQGDYIDLSAIDANTNTGADDAFTWIGTGAFTHTAGELRYVLSGSTATVYGDTNGDGVADFAFKVGNVGGVMSDTDFHP